jgi:hydrogenase maturation protein HypF
MGILGYVPEARTKLELEAVARVAKDGSLSPGTSSCGRLFDAAAAILGFGRRVGFEGEAAIWLEALASEALVAASASRAAGGLPEFPALDGPALLGLLAARAEDPQVMPRDALAALALGFHIGLAENIAEAAAAKARRFDLDEVALSGGVFQNRLFLEATIGALGRRGMEAIVGGRVPVNDGGISVGQAAAGILAATLKGED